MSTRVFVAGATGVLGQRVVPALVAAGHTVTANVRTGAARRAVEAAGVEARADILKAPRIDLGRIMAGLERASAIQRDMQLEADDEEVMLLL